MRFKLFKDGKTNRYEAVPEEKSEVRKDALNSKAPGPKVIGVDVTQVNDADDPHLFHPAVSPDRDGDFDSIADEKTSALASQLHSWANPYYTGDMGGTRYTIALPDGEYRAMRWPDSSFFVKDGVIVRVEGPDAYETVAGWSSRQETVVVDDVDRAIADSGKPIRVGDGWVMNPDNSGLSDQAPFRRVVPGMSLGGRPVSDMAQVKKSRRPRSLFTNLILGR